MEEEYHHVPEDEELAAIAARQRSYENSPTVQQASRLSDQAYYAGLAERPYNEGEWHEARTAALISQAYGALWVNHAG